MQVQYSMVFLYPWFFVFLILIIKNIWVFLMLLQAGSRQLACVLVSNYPQFYGGGGSMGDQQYSVRQP